MSIKLGKLPDRTPVKLTISFPPDIHMLLGEYLAAYRIAHQDEAATPADIVPIIVASFIESDRAFNRGRKARRDVS
jgi:hypothetical protein